MQKTGDMSFQYPFGISLKYTQGTCLGCSCPIFSISLRDKSQVYPRPCKSLQRLILMSKFREPIILRPLERTFRIRFAPNSLIVFIVAYGNNPKQEVGNLYSTRLKPRYRIIHRSLALRYVIYDLSAQTY